MMNIAIYIKTISCFNAGKWIMWENIDGNVECDGNVICVASKEKKNKVFF